MSHELLDTFVVLRLLKRLIHFIQKFTEKKCVFRSTSGGLKLEELAKHLHAAERVS